MADPLFELLVPYFDGDATTPALHSPATVQYLARLSTLSAGSLTSTEPESLGHESQSLLRSLQALTKRSYKSIDNSVDSLACLRQSLPAIASNAGHMQRVLPALGSNALTFAQKYSKIVDNPVLDRRRMAMKLGDNVDRLSDILELPTLLSSTISASTSASASSAAGSLSSANAHYASALDLYAHIKRLQKLYPDSELINSISEQAEEAMRGMTTSLISTLRSQSLKLASAMRLIGLLRRIAPELDDSGGQKNWSSQPSEGALGALFLICRLSNLNTTLEALEPLRELADQESAQKSTNGSSSEERSTIPGGHQSERFLKRYIEVFREQCFAIVSMYKSIFPTSLQTPGAAAAQSDLVPKLNVRSLQRTSLEDNDDVDTPEDPMQKTPSALSTFTLHLVDTLMNTLRDYLPNIQDQGSRDSLLTQVLYCAGSLGRLGGDFGMMLALLEEDVKSSIRSTAGDHDASSPEWVEVMKKHRIQAGRLELLASGVTSKAAALPVMSKEVVSTG